MKRYPLLIFSFFLLKGLSSFAQNRPLMDTSIKSLEEVVISFNKWEQNLNEVPNRIMKVDMRDARLRNPQTTADLLAQTGGVFIQKSQLGGGSPMIRGFATNRVLIVADGVRMNNAIYRSGNLQNIISIDPLSIDDAEVIFGPGSLIYGSDAIGGVMDFHSLPAAFTVDSKSLAKGAGFVRYSSANKEKTVHAHLNTGWRKWSLLSSVTYSSFDDQRMGKNNGPDSYLRKEYVERINDRDSIVTNNDPRIQRFTGYDQLNFLQKIRYKPSDNLDLQYSFTYAGTGNAPRYDRLLQYRQGKPRFAEWYYGPMIWRMHTVQIIHQKKNLLYDKSRLIMAYQHYDESRIDRTRDNNNRNTQAEKVSGFSLNWDAQKELPKGELYYGIEYVYNRVGSNGFTKNILNNVSNPIGGRYPDGSTWSTSGIYGSYKVNMHTRTTFTTGLRYTQGSMKAVFDTSFIRYPYTNLSINAGALTGNAGFVYRPADTWQLNINMSTGFRFPNIDDAGKTFESTPGNLTVPNPELKSEYAWNAELGAVKSISKKLKIELTVFYTFLDNALIRRPYTFNGSDSIEYGGQMLGVEALQNAAKATVWGLQAGIEIYLTQKLVLQSNANWIEGKETDDIINEQVPLRHAPPFYGNTNLRYRYNKFFIELSSFYNSEINNKNLAPTEQAKPEIYAKDENGKPYSPSWYNVNIKASYQLSRHLLVTAGWENITDQRYRPYSSGIVSAGSNFIFSARATL
jgi:hemoglobin/transferrin/lactoferrin receptor protein